MAQQNYSARSAAVQLLSGVLATGRMLSEVDYDTNDKLGPADRARAYRLAQTVLRNLQRADSILAPHLQKHTPLRARNTMRLAVVEMGELGAPAHGAVSSAVDVLRGSTKTQHLTGLVNAVLRAVADDLPKKWADLPPDRMPKWLRASLVKSWGEDVVAQIEVAHAKGAPIDLSYGPRMSDELLATLPVETLPTGSLRLQGSQQITALDGFDEGAFWVQDAAAAVPVKVLDPKPGEQILDLCAAPGGKTMQLAASGANVTAVDASSSRMKRVRENLDRTHLKAKLVVADLLRWEPENQVDAILLDAPCSASGTLRRHPDLPYVKDGNGVKAIAQLQAELIDRAAAWLKPGGRLVFATCSLLPMEGEQQALAVVTRGLGLSIDTASLAVPGADPKWIGETGLRLRPDYWPEIGGMDGFFVTRFAKD